MSRTLSTRRLVAGIMAVVAAAGGVALSAAPAAAADQPFTPISTFPKLDMSVPYRIVVNTPDQFSGTRNIGAQHFDTSGGGSIFALAVRPKDGYNPAGEQWLFRQVNDNLGNPITENGNPVVFVVSNRLADGYRYVMDTENIPYTIEGPGGVVGTSPFDVSGTQQWVLSKVFDQFTLKNRSAHSPNYLSFDMDQNRFEQYHPAQRHSIQFSLEIVV
ncbi:hypothetical protein O7627_19610 [Solwaraspora sp. WMMD1047]|uniref:hypothetical protein n=1 Tax=Solwaraspora sp. WMMD1047 TaxID=3016102 RepID=UPI0024173AF8|nr:hypothetical protein [Solwaraspora sp. WMMD1047]MDG4831508.1 hypothetical protein [Solwaraspora sp. WMMD1047]